MEVVGEFFILSLSVFGTVVLFYLISFCSISPFVAVIGNSTEQNLLKLSYFFFFLLKLSYFFLLKVLDIVFISFFFFEVELFLLIYFKASYFTFYNGGSAC